MRVYVNNIFKGELPAFLPRADLQKNGTCHAGGGFELDASALSSFGVNKFRITAPDGSILDNLTGYLGNPQSANGAGILGHIFGNQRPAIESNLAQATGMDQNSAGGLLETLAPMVMGSLGKAQQQNELGPSDLSNLLNREQQEAQANAPDVMSMLGSMLDQNKDGSSIDDIQRMAAKFFK